jgi:large subunit ribosomal protein L25
MRARRSGAALPGGDMSEHVTIQVQPRVEVGKNESRRLRRAGLVPAVVYGGGREPEGVAFDPRPLEVVLLTERGKNTLLHLRVGDRELKRAVLVREIQRHPVTDRILHADFVRVEMDRKTEVDVPIVAVGIAAGVKNEGGLLEYIHRTVTVRCLPADIPEHIEADVTALHVGQHLEAGELQLPAGVELAMPPGETLVTIAGKQAEEAPTTAAAAPAEGEGGTTPAAGA